MIGQVVHVQELGCLTGQHLCCLTCQQIIWSLLLGQTFQETGTVHRVDFSARYFVSVLKAEKHPNTYSHLSHATKITQPLVITTGL